MFWFWQKCTLTSIQATLFTRLCWWQLCCVSRNNNPLLSSLLMTNYQVCGKSNTTVTNTKGTKKEEKTWSTTLHRKLDESMYCGMVSIERRYLDPCHLLTSVIVFCFHQPFLFAIFYSITNTTMAIVFSDWMKFKVSSKKSLEIPKGYKVSINRRTDNTMAKQKCQRDKQRSTKHYT